MATSEAQVRKYLDPEEPDYKAAAAALGADALPVLATLIQSADPLLASKATYLASLIPHEQAARVLEQAARSDHPTVRVAAAAGLQRRPEVSNDTAAELAADPDPGVRKVAARATRARDRSADPAPHDQEGARRGTRPGGVSGRPLEGEHGGGFSPGTTGDADRAEGEGGGDLGETRARPTTAMAGTDPESGGGGDVGGGAAGSGGVGDGGGSIDGTGNTTTSQHGGGSV